MYNLPLPWEHEKANQKVIYSNKWFRKGITFFNAKYMVTIWLVLRVQVLCYNFQTAEAITQKQDPFNCSFFAEQQDLLTPM